MKHISFWRYILWSCLIFVLTACNASNSDTSSTPEANKSVQMGGAIQGKPLSLYASVTTFAGAATGLDGTGVTARFISPGGITTDGVNVYVTDCDNTIRKIEIATGKVTTLAGTPGVYGSADGVGAAASFNGPTGIVAVGTNLYVVDRQNGTIRKIDIATKAVTTLAGNPLLHGSSFDGIGSTATFNQPTEIAFDGTNLFVADEQGGKIRKVVIAIGEVTTLATNNSFGGGIAVVGANLYVASGITIHKVEIGTGAVTYFQIDTGILPPVVNPSWMTSDGANIYFADSYDHTIRKVEIATGVVTTLAGHAGTTSAVDGIDSAASFQSPTHVTSDGVNLYVIDDRSVRKVVIATGEVTTLAGSTSTTADGTGAAARFSVPNDVTTDGQSLFVTDSGTIRKVAITTGTVTTLAGTRGVYGSQDGTGAAASFGSPEYITTDGVNLFVSDNNQNTIRKIVIATGEVSTLVGSVGVRGSANGTGATASFSGPSGITTDGMNLFLADSGNHSIRKIVIATGIVSTLAGSAEISGSADGVGSFASFFLPRGITTDGTNLFVADYGNKIIRKVVIETSAVTTLAGSAGVYGSADGIGPAAKFSYPTGISTDGIYLYLTDGSLIRRIDIASGVVTTLAGNAGRGGSIDSTGIMARFNAPCGITTDGKHLYLADSGNKTIRRIE